MTIHSTWLSRRVMFEPTPSGKNLQWFRGGLALKDHRPLCHSILGSRVMPKKKRLHSTWLSPRVLFECPRLGAQMLATSIRFASHLFLSSSALFRLILSTLTFNGFGAQNRRIHFRPPQIQSPISLRELSASHLPRIPPSRSPAGSLYGRAERLIHSTTQVVDAFCPKVNDSQYKQQEASVLRMAFDPSM